MTSTYPFFPKMVFTVFPLLFWLMIILTINRNMPLLVKMRVNQVYTINGSQNMNFNVLGPFCFFGPKNGIFTELQTLNFFFGNKQHPNDVKKHI